MIKLAEVHQGYKHRVVELSSKVSCHFMFSSVRHLVFVSWHTHEEYSVLCVALIPLQSFYEEGQAQRVLVCNAAQ